MKDFIDFYTRVLNFNNMAGVKNHKDVGKDFWDSVNLQSKLLVEEAKECLKASEEKDVAEILKESVDVLVVTFKLVDFLEAAGYDVLGAAESICDNNDSKIYKDYWKAVADKEAFEANTGKEFYIETSYVNNLEYYTVRNDYGKITKPVGFRSVDLTPHIPK